MRIGIDMLGAQSPGSRGRGIGRYGLELASAMLRIDPRNEYLFYARPILPTEGFPTAPNARVRPVPEASNAASESHRLAHENPDGLDALLLLSPFELHDGFDPPSSPLGKPAMAAVVYDLIPFLFQEKYLTWPPVAARFYRNLERLRRYDALLAISEATRADCRRLLGLGAGKVTNVSGASDPGFFTPEHDPEDIEELGRLGIDRPFVYCLGSFDDRKNLKGLIDAFGLLPDDLRASHQLVVTFHIKPEEAEALRDHARSRGVADALILTGGLPDAGIRALYRRCAAFAHPSHYEGLGLPLLEAMLCGAAVIGGDNSSQVEVVGEAGLLANAAEPAEIADRLTRLLTDETLSVSLRAKARPHALTFNWDDSGRRAVAAIERAVGAQDCRPRGRRTRIDLGHSSRPRIAVCSPWPPKRSGISDYAARLVEELAGRYAIDIFHDPEYLPDKALRCGPFACHDIRLLPRMSRVRPYHARLYQMGNSAYHGRIYDLALQYPGIVTLHDYSLAGFHAWYGAHHVGEVTYFAREFAYAHPDAAESVLPNLPALSKRPGGLGSAISGLGYHLNRRLIESSEAVVFHSRTFRDRASGENPERSGRFVRIPLGAEPVPKSAQARLAVRERFGLPAVGLVVASFGIIYPSKLNEETIEAFAAIAGQFPNALLLFVGRDLSATPASARAAELGLGNRVRFLGHQPADRYDALLQAVDVGVALRRPPTNGETSAALLDLLRHGIPTIINDAGSFAEIPGSIARKLRWEHDGVLGLIEALRGLLEDPDARDRLGKAAADHVARRHAWPLVAADYARLIEETAAGGPISSPSRRRDPARARPRIAGD